MDLRDGELLEALIGRDGALPERWRAHSAEGRCRYVEYYGEQSCPWCEAEERRLLRERDAPASAQDTPEETA